MTEVASFSPPPLPADPAGPPSVVSRTAEGAVGLAVLVLVGLLGLPLGWLWQFVAPHTPAVRRPDGAYLTQPEAEHRIADEGWYLVLTVSLGVLLAVLTWVVLRRYRGPIVAAALTLGSAVCGVVTWKFGHHFGYAQARSLIDAQTWTGTTNFTLPVDLRAAKAGLWHGWLPYANGDVLGMAIAVLLVYLLLAGFSPYPALRQTHSYPLPTDPAATPTGYTGYQPWTPTSYGQPAPPIGGQPTPPPTGSQPAPPVGGQPGPPA